VGACSEGGRVVTVATRSGKDRPLTPALSPSEGERGERSPVMELSGTPLNPEGREALHAGRAEMR